MIMPLGSMLGLIFELAFAEGHFPCAADEIPFSDSMCAPRADIRDEARKFIVQSMPPPDKENGLAGRMLDITLDLALEAKKLSWAKDTTRQDFFRYVATYAETNEPRTNWRELFWKKLKPYVPQKARTPEDIIAWLNGGGAGFLWTKAFNAKLTFQPNRTPEVFDPMSVIAFEGASCTGVSTMYVFALRSLGIPARIAGTPAWNGKDKGMDNNHSWVEILINGKWHFTEAKPSGTGPADNLTDPCDKWFCNPKSMHNTTVYSSAWDGVPIPLSWALKYPYARGVDRSDYYRSTCAQCKGKKDERIITSRHPMTAYGV